MNPATDLHSIPWSQVELAPLTLTLSWVLSIKSPHSSDQHLKTIWTAFWRQTLFFSGDLRWNQSTGHLRLTAQNQLWSKVWVLEKLRLFLELIRSTSETGTKNSRRARSCPQLLCLREYRETELTQRFIMTLWKQQRRELFRSWIKRLLLWIHMIMLSSRFMCIIRSSSVSQLTSIPISKTSAAKTKTRPLSPVTKTSKVLKFSNKLTFQTFTSCLPV